MLRATIYIFQENRQSHILPLSGYHLRHILGLIIFGVFYLAVAIEYPA